MAPTTLDKRKIRYAQSLIDRKFREALEEQSTIFDREVAAIKSANHFDMLTMAFVTNEQYISIDDAHRDVKKIFDLCKKVKPEVLRMMSDFRHG